MRKKEFAMCLPIIPTVFLLTSCTTPPGYANACPVVPEYSPSFQQEAGRQLAALPPNSPLVVMTEDYLAMRRASRDCAK